MNIEDFINEIENDEGTQFKTEQEKKYQELLNSYKDILSGVVQTDFFEENMKEIVNDTYRVLKSSAEYFLVKKVSDTNDIPIKSACKKVGFDLEGVQMGEQFIDRIIYPTLLKFCSEVAKINKLKK